MSLKVFDAKVEVVDSSSRARATEEEVRLGWSLPAGLSSEQWDEALRVKLIELEMEKDEARAAERFELGDRILDLFDEAGLLALDPYTGDLEGLAYRCRAKGHSCTLRISTSGAPLDGPLGCLLCRLDEEELDFQSQLLDLRGAAYGSDWDRAKADIKVITTLQKYSSIKELSKEKEEVLASLEKLYRPLVPLETDQKAEFSVRGGGYRSDRPGLLYYVRFDTDDGPLWKIGITARSARDRFAGEPLPFAVVWERLFDDGRIPPNLERQILRQYSQHKYQGSALASGNTECFTCDIFRGANVDSIVAGFIY